MKDLECVGPSNEWLNKNLRLWFENVLDHLVKSYHADCQSRTMRKMEKAKDINVLLFLMPREDLFMYTP